MARAMWLSLGSASRSSGDSLRLPGAETNGATKLQRRSQKATTLSPLRSLSAVPQVVAALLRRSGRAVAMNDRELEQPVLVKLAHRAAENPVDAVIGLPPPQCPIDACFGFQDDLRHSFQSVAPSTDSPCTAAEACS
jgi:hypothetical protein